MNSAHSTARSTSDYQPTIIETRFLIERLAIQIASLRQELKPNWLEFKRNPRAFLVRTAQTLWRRLRNSLSAPYVLSALSTAIAAVVFIVLAALLTEKMTRSPGLVVTSEPPDEMVWLNTANQNGFGIGLNGTGRVGFKKGSGEGSAPTPQHSGGGGSGGNGTPLPSQRGELPPPSEIPAAIPIVPPLYRPALPVAGIDIDPALWQDLKAPVYGDPLSASEIPSKGPGTGEGIGTKSGTGIGDGDGPGYGPGKDGNTGTGDKQIGCCGSGGGRGGNTSGIANSASGSGYIQRAHVLFKPEPQYTEDARKNQITGTVVLKVVFASSGDVVQIRVVRTLPFGLTEQAIAAARQIKFEPAKRDGQPVSIAMQLEYNFNLY